jgi:hypothetical protein
MAGLLGAGWASNEFFVVTLGAIPGMTRFQSDKQNANEFLNLIEDQVWIVQLG